MSFSHLSLGRSAPNQPAAAPSRAVSSQRLWTRTPCTPGACSELRGHRGRDFPARRGRAPVSRFRLHSRRGRGKTSARGLRFLATCKAPCSFSLSHARQGGETSPAGIPLSPFPSIVTALAGHRWTLPMCRLRGEPSGTALAMEHKGCLQEFAPRFLEVQRPGALRMALSPYPLSSTPGELPTSLPSSRLGKRGWIWPQNVLPSRSAVHHPHKQQVWICPLFTPKQGGAGTWWWWVVDTHGPQVQGEDERSTGEMSMHVQI